MKRMKHRVLILSSTTLFFAVCAGLLPSFGEDTKPPYRAFVDMKTFMELRTPSRSGRPRLPRMAFFAMVNTGPDCAVTFAQTSSTFFCNSFSVLWLRKIANRAYALAAMPPGSIAPGGCTCRHIQHPVAMLDSSLSRGHYSRL